MLCGPHKFRAWLAPAVIIFALLQTMDVVAAQAQCGRGGTALSLDRQLSVRETGYTGFGNVCDIQTTGFTTSLGQSSSRAPADIAVPREGPPSGVAYPRHNSLDMIRLYCRRDDYAFLPPQANGGLPCTVTTTGASVDPRAIAAELLSRLSLPDLRLNMNPRLGLVAVPTWFWVEGYSGDVIPLSRSLTIPREECTLVVERNARGDPVLDPSGVPVVHQRCVRTLETIGVELRVWPSTYHWSFGDAKEQLISCGGIGACRSGLGRAYTDPHTPSPIQHAYVFSSLGQQGETDAYGVNLSITFSAQYRFSRNGTVVDGWQGLPDRELSWSADHRVREAQAVLTRP